jgi:hypothetical protein
MLRITSIVALLAVTFLSGTQAAPLEVKDFAEKLQHVFANDAEVVSINEIVDLCCTDHYRHRSPTLVGFTRFIQWCVAT